ncbi:MAG: amidohydrolase family protein [Acidimicrobiales bacterium]
MAVQSDFQRDFKVIDTDAHWSEPHDLWTARAPEKYRDLVPQVKDHNGKRRWVIQGDTVLAPAHATSAIAADGGKILGLDFLKYDVDQVHVGCSQVAGRLELLDGLGIQAQVLYPNVAGFGSQNFMRVDDAALRRACVEIYNDYMADLQKDSGNRLLPMAMIPWWDIDASVVEIERAQGLGLRGIVTCSNPQDGGMPEYNQPEWRPFWEVVSALRMPVNFHIGASTGDIDWFGRVPYKSWPGEVKITIGGASLFLGNARWMANLLFSDIWDRYPDVRIVSVESGVSWIPFLLEALDYQAGETAPEFLKHLSAKPSEYYRKHCYSTYWFESRGLDFAVRELGEDRVMFETDIPHPTSLYPNSIDRAKEAAAKLPESTQRKIFYENAAELYKLG